MWHSTLLLTGWALIRLQPGMHCTRKESCPVSRGDDDPTTTQVVDANWSSTRQARDIPAVRCYRRTRIDGRRFRHGSSEKSCLSAACAVQLSTARRWITKAITSQSRSFLLTPTSLIDMGSISIRARACMHSCRSLYRPSPIRFIN